MSGFKLDILDMAEHDTVRSCPVMSGNMSGCSAVNYCSSRQESMFFGCDHFHLVWVGSVRDTLINQSGRAFGGWYVLVWVLRGGAGSREKSLRRFAAIESLNRLTSLFSVQANLT